MLRLSLVSPRLLFESSAVLFRLRTLLAQSQEPQVSLRTAFYSLIVPNLTRTVAAVALRETLKKLPEQGLVSPRQTRGLFDLALFVHHHRYRQLSGRGNSETAPGKIAWNSYRIRGPVSRFLILQATRLLSKGTDVEQYREILGMFRPSKRWFVDLEVARLSSEEFPNEAWRDVLQRPFLESGLAEISAVHKAHSSEGSYLGLTSSTPRKYPSDFTVSAVVTAFNPGPWLRDSIESLLNQSVSLREVILVDDCSDSTYVAFIKEVSQLSPSVQLIRLPENVGTYRARAVALSHVTGSYVVFQDSDDWSHPQRVELQIETMVSGGYVASLPVCARFESDLGAAWWRQTAPGHENGPGLIAETDALKSIAMNVLTSGRRVGVDGQLVHLLDNSHSSGVAKHRVVSSGGPVPLLFQLSSPSSLSGQDYLFGWENPSRRRAKYGYRYGLPTNKSSGPDFSIEQTLVVGGFSWREQERSARLALKALRKNDGATEGRKVIYLPNPIAQNVLRRSPALSELYRQAGEGIVFMVSQIDPSSRVVFCGLSSIGLLDEGDLLAVPERVRVVLPHYLYLLRPARIAELAGLMLKVIGDSQSRIPVDIEIVSVRNRSIS